MKLTWWQWCYVYVMLVCGFEPRRVVFHVGATTEWRPTEDYRDQQEWQDVELLDGGAQVIAVHEGLNKIDKALEEFREHIDDIIWRLCNNDPMIVMQVYRWGDSTMEDTGSFDVRELEALLAIGS